MNISVFQSLNLNCWIVGPSSYWSFQLFVIVS
jgi:hypothetical protein